MPSASAPFTCLTFAVSKPGWGTSSLVISLASPEGYELRVKRIENGVSTEDGVRSYGLADAGSLDRWIRALGFYEEGVSSPRVPGAGWWSLAIASEDGDVRRGGTACPASFPDLLATMAGLGLPGVGRGGEASFLSDFGTVRPTPGGEASSSSRIPALSALSGMPGLEQALAEIMKDPEAAEASLREQFRQVPDAAKQELLASVRQNDPEHYEWWRRILFG